MTPEPELPTPNPAEALNGAAMAALKRGEVQACLDLLAQARQAAPQDVATCVNLGIANAAAGELVQAADYYREALALDPQLDAARLQYANVLERLGHHRDALRAYFRALRSAQLRGRWLSPATTAPGVRPLVEHAIAFVTRGQRALLDEVLSPLLDRFGRDALVRVDHCVRAYVGEAAASFPDPRQQPTFLYFPGLPAQPYYPRERFDWVAEYEAATAALREELLAFLPRTEGREPVFHNADLAQANLQSGRGAPRWDGFYFYRHGARNDVNARNGPRTFAAIERLPLARVPGNAPEVMYSVLAPGTHLLPHRGVTNTRLVTHLPIIVPEECALRVGGELHEWREGRAVIFDDTYEHEAWNRSSETRVVLIADIWHPDLTEAERVAMADVAAALGEFSRGAEQA